MRFTNNVQNELNSFSELSSLKSFIERYKIG